MLSIYWVRRADGDGTVEILSTDTLGNISPDQAHDRAKLIWPVSAGTGPRPDGWQIVNEFGTVLIEQFPSDGRGPPQNASG